MVIPGTVNGLTQTHPANTNKIKITMKIKNIFFTLATTFVLSFSFTAAYAQTWQLDGAHSSLTYLSFKISGDRSIYEPNHFSRLDGTLSASGANINVDLSSIDTRVAIRDERVLEHVFHAKKFPRAQVSLSAVTIPEVGDTVEQVVDAQLTMRGKAAPVRGRVSVTRPNAKLIVVQTIEPVLVDGTQWAMEAGFETLRQLVNLKHISTTIPVSFKFTFRAQ